MLTIEVLKNILITDERDIFTYFELIRKVNPTSILDIGMFLKRIGAIDRQVMNSEISTQIQLDGVDFFPEIELPVYQEIYNHIFTIDTMPKDKYDMAIMLDVNKLLYPNERQQLWKYAITHAHKVHIEKYNQEMLEFMLQYGTVQQYEIEGKIYLFVKSDMGEA